MTRGKTVTNDELLEIATRSLQGETDEMIADGMNRPIGTVKNNIYRMIEEGILPARKQKKDALVDIKKKLKELNK